MFSTDKKSKSSQQHSVANHGTHTGHGTAANKVGVASQHLKSLNSLNATSHGMRATTAWEDGMHLTESEVIMDEKLNFVKQVR